MRGRVQGEAEDVVGARLRAILAAAAPRPGWVPGRVAEPSIEHGRPTRPDQDVGQIPRPDPARQDEPGQAYDLDQAYDPAQAYERDSAQTDRTAAGWGSRLRWDPGRPGAVAMCVVAVLAAALTAGLTWWFRPEPPAADAADMTPAGLAGAPAGGGTAASDRTDPAGTAASGAGQVPDVLVVSVIGLVHQPGLVSVPQGSRVADAIDAAGGALPGADLSTVNLARLVEDGEQVAVGVAGSSVPGGDTAAGQGLVDLNTASEAELEALPGIGPVLAQRIIDFREENGGFTAVEQLREVSGVGPTVYDDIVELVTV